METDIYHEKQSRELCALHALNNLFQTENYFTKAELDSMCYSLSPDSWINPHKSSLGLGNYDINVITAALNSKNMDLVWFDKRKDPRIIKLDSIVGCILNVPNDWKVGWISLPFNRKHWIAFKKINNVWYNLDSKIKTPEEIGEDEEFYKYIQNELESGTKELFIVMTDDVCKDESWKHS